LQAVCSRIFRYAVATGRCQYDPSRDLHGAVPPAKSGHFASLTDPLHIAALLRAIETYSGDYSTLYALRLSPYVFVRPGELRHAEWHEIDFKAKQWRIPAEKMKMRREHIVPLSQQSVAIFKEIQALNTQRRYVFSSLRTPKRPISNNTLNAALRCMGYRKDQMTAHGFRSMASTLLNEQGFRADIIEKQLAHEERNAIRAAYNRAEYLPERTQMMQHWADYLDQLRQEVMV
jgi:integrase